MTYLTAAPLHLGALHPYELLLVLVIGFGPFVVLAVVVSVLRRRAGRHDLASEESRDAAANDRSPTTPARRAARR